MPSDADAACQYHRPPTRRRPTARAVVESTPIHTHGAPRPAPPAMRANRPDPLSLRQLAQQFAQPGRLDAIWLRPARATPALSAPRAEAMAGQGLLGDRSARARPGLAPGLAGGKRQITLLQAEHLPVIAALAGLAAGVVDAGLLRRNLLVSGLNLLAARALFKDSPLLLQLGDDPASSVLLEITGPCEPCSKMAAALGRGGYTAMRGHGGVTARVLRGGWLAVGAAVHCLPQADPGPVPR